MKPLTKVLLTFAMALFFVGAIACAATYIISEKSLTSLGIDTSYEQTEYVYEAGENEELFAELNIIVDRHHVIIKQSSDVDTLHISYAENEYDKFVIEKVKDKLYFTNNGIKNLFFRRFCLLFDAKKEKEELNTVVVTIPMDYKGKLNVESSNADLQLYGVAGISGLSVKGDDSDVAVDYVTVPTASVEMKNGNLAFSGCVFDDLDINLVNKAVYEEIEDGEEIDVTPTPEESVEPTPEPTTAPEETVDPEATLNPEETLLPEVTPEPTPKSTPKPTPKPKKLVIDKEISFNNIDFKNAKITTTYTDITGNVVRNSLFYNIKTNNKESSNIENYENKSSQGSITIEQIGGKTELYFK